MSSPAPSDNEIIAQRAYQLWEAGDHAHGHDQDHWHQAERELHEKELKAEQAEVRGKRVEPPLSGHPAPLAAPHSTNRSHPAVTTDSLHHQRVSGGRMPN